MTTARKIDRVIAGLTILAVYATSGTAAEHDIIYAGPGKENISDSDAKKLEDLGWFFDSDSDSWATFT